MYRKSRSPENNLGYQQGIGMNVVPQQQQIQQGVGYYQYPGQNTNNINGLNSMNSPGMINNVYQYGQSVPGIPNNQPIISMPGQYLYPPGSQLQTQPINPNMNNINSMNNLNSMNVNMNTNRYPNNIAPNNNNYNNLIQQQSQQSQQPQTQQWHTQPNPSHSLHLPIPSMQTATQSIPLISPNKMVNIRTNNSYQYSNNPNNANNINISNNYNQNYITNQSHIHNNQISSSQPNIINNKINYTNNNM